MRNAQPEWRDYYNQLSVEADAEGIGRRRFLQGLLASGAVLATGAGFAMPSAFGFQPLGPTDRILVVVMMGGGNDGYSMVIPADNGSYQDARGPLAISPANAIPLADGPGAEGLYWNSNCVGLSERYAAGDVAVVQGIGDPADDHSHFSSMARWMRGFTDDGLIGFTGWLGRYLDGANLSQLGAINVGDSGVPLHLRGSSSKVTALPRNDNLFGASLKEWEIPQFMALSSLRDQFTNDPWLAGVSNAVADSIDSAAFLSPVYGSDTLPEDGIQRDLALAAETINLNIGARILGVSFGDFDTHDDHEPRHQELMANFDQAVTGFFNRLNPALADRVTLMTFSEFGRSWTANDSAGIDHGTTSTTLVIGNAVTGGLYGQAPDYNSFDQAGDLESVVDFRSYYATILEGWLEADSQEILGGSYEDLGIFDPPPPAPEPTPTATATATPTPVPSPTPEGTTVPTNGPDLCHNEKATIIATLGGGPINGTSDRDVIIGTAGDDVIYGMGGNDLICSGEGADVIWGGAGNDVIIAGAGDDTLYGEDGDDELLAGDGKDVARGGPGNDTVRGGSGDDRLLGGTGDDTINGGEGDDYLGGFGGNDMLYGDAGNEKIYGGFGADTIEGGPGNDTVYGLVGDDTIRGGAGNDTLNGDRGNDTINGGKGSDLINGGNANDMLHGDGGNDTINGGKADDTLFGGDGQDSCSGNKENNADVHDDSCEATFGFP